MAIKSDGVNLLATYGVGARTRELVNGGNLVADFFGHAFYGAFGAR